MITLEELHKSAFLMGRLVIVASISPLLQKSGFYGWMHLMKDKKSYLQLVKSPVLGFRKMWKKVLWSEETSVFLHTYNMLYVEEN